MMWFQSCSVISRKGFTKFTPALLINNGLTQATGGELTICADAIRFERIRKGDFDADGDVDSDDFDAFKATYHSVQGQPTPPYNSCGDFDEDGDVDFWDFMEFIDAFGT